MDSASALAESMDPTNQLFPDQTQPVETIQITQPYGGLTQDSRQKWKRLTTKSHKVESRTDPWIPPALRYMRENATARRKTTDATA